MQALDDRPPADSLLSMSWGRPWRLAVVRPRGLLHWPRAPATAAPRRAPESSCRPIRDRPQPRDSQPRGRFAAVAAAPTPAPLPADEACRRGAAVSEQAPAGPGERWSDPGARQCDPGWPDRPGN